MAGSTNFQQWNPNQTNQESDSQYSSDSTRQSGAVDNTAFLSTLANKLFYQISTLATALAQAMANKGYTATDTSLSQLTTVFQNIVTQADQVPPMIALPFASNLTFDGSKTNGWDVSLSGNVTASSTINLVPGRVYTFVMSQDNVGGRVISAPPAIGNLWVQPDPGPNAVSQISYYVRVTDGSVRPQTGMTVS